MNTPALYGPACSSPSRCQHNEKLATKLTQMRKSRQLTDFNLCVGSVHEIRCHRVILAASSPYFAAYFESHKETLNERESYEFSFCNVLGYRIVEQIVDYFYTGVIDINKENIKALIDASEHLGLDELKTDCVDLMMSQIESNNCVVFFKFAKAHHLKELQMVAQDYILDHFEDVITKSEEFVELSEKELVTLISDDRLTVRCEDPVFCVVKQWVGAESKDRNEIFERIAKHIRFPFCSKDFLGQLMYRESLMRSPECEVFLKRAVYSTFFPEGQAYPECIPRLSYASLFPQPVLRCIKQDSTDVKLMRFDNQQWITSWVGEFPDNVDCYALNTSVAVIGKVIGLWQIGRKEFHSLPPLPCDNTYCSCILHMRKLMVFAEAEESVLALGLTVDDEKEWVPLAPMLKAPRRPLAVSFGHFVYVFDVGKDTEADSRVTQVYNHLLNHWKTASPMPFQCSGGVAVVFNEKIYIFGGEIQTAMSYDPAKDNWSVLAPPLSEHVSASAAVWKGKILLNGCGSDSVEEYDPEKDCWVYRLDLALDGRVTMFRSVAETN